MAPSLRMFSWCGVLALCFSCSVCSGFAKATETHTRAPRRPETAPAGKSTSIPAAPARRESALDESPQPPKVRLDHGELTVGAENSDLGQILDQVSLLSGMRIDGLGKSSRVFGVYGPGSPKEVLARLLSGSGYNFMMVGESGDGAPRQLLLTAREPGDNGSSAENASRTASSGASGRQPSEGRGRFQRELPAGSHGGAVQAGAPSANQTEKGEAGDQPGPEDLGPGAIYPAPPPQSEDRQERMQQMMQRLERMHKAQPDSNP